MLIIKHCEDTASLEEFLASEGFDVELVMGPYPPEAERFDGSIRCLINHRNAWRRASFISTPTIIVEADFVPVVGFGALPLPMSVKSEGENAFCYLYSCGAVLYGMDEQGYLFGHSSSTVAYSLTPSVAALLEEFAEEKIKSAGGTWQAWDADLSPFLRRKKGVRTHLPLAQYGEHGGVPNPSHRGRVFRSWHQADVLADPLAFSPIYMRGNHIRYIAFRLRSVVWAWARLLALRFFDPRYVNNQTERGRLAMAAVAILRLLLPPRLVGMFLRLNAWSASGR